MPGPSKLFLFQAAAVVLSVVAIGPGALGQSKARRPSKSAPGASGASRGGASATALPAGWSLRFQDEFDGTGIDFSKWSPHAPGNLVFAGIQAWLPANVTIGGGVAHLQARRTGSEVTSGVLTTFGNFAQTYGRYEIRCRAVNGAGLRSIVELLPIPTGEFPAIDILNVAGDRLQTPSFESRWTEGNTERSYGATPKAVDLSAGFHTITLVWESEGLVWSVDGQEKLQSFEGVPHQPMYLVLRVEADEPVQSGGTFDIDYVRIFARPE